MINKVTLIGNIGKDPETRTFDNGSEVCQFSLATSKSWKDKAGEWQEKTTWHNIVAWGNKVQQAAKLQKGDTLYLEGEIDNRSYEKDGQTRYISEINASYIRKLNKSEAKQYEQPAVKELMEGSEDLPF
jgi:single-strand DNA-binding protein